LTVITYRSQYACVSTTIHYTIHEMCLWENIGERNVKKTRSSRKRKKNQFSTGERTQDDGSEKAGSQKRDSLPKKKERNESKMCTFTSVQLPNGVNVIE
jgi:hypothetical protein